MTWWITDPTVRRVWHGLGFLTVWLLTTWLNPVRCYRTGRWYTRNLILFLIVLRTRDVRLYYIILWEDKNDEMPYSKISQGLEATRSGFRCALLFWILYACKISKRFVTTTPVHVHYYNNNLTWLKHMCTNVFPIISGKSNERYGVSNHQQVDWLLKSLFR